ncbi:MAG: amino acid adenylation domain-containing protein, partial [Halanaerobiales bacterium]|nr:amino acid adenylation domain-containing protein [Halanaerobiales bacterium]
YYEASSAQKRMYLLQQFDLSSTSYNMPGVLEVEGILNIERVEKAFYELIRRHETLRTSFETIEDKVIQKIYVDVEFKVDYTDKPEQVIEKVIKDFVRPFDLNKAPLLRVHVIKLDKNRHILMYDMHHIISDGTSMGILVSEFADFYKGQTLEKLKIQYKDYADWQNKLLNDVMKDQEEYWINKFTGNLNDTQIPVLNLPTDYPRPVIQSHEGDKLSFIVEEKLTKELKRLVKETNSTMYMVLLSAINILLSKYSNQEDIIIGSPIAGRLHPDLEKIIGVFVNTLAMRNYPENNKIYEEFLKEVKENALEAYKHQNYQFEELVDKLDLTRDMSRNPLFDVLFVMQNMDIGQLNLNDVKFTRYNFENRTSKFDLSIFAIEADEKLLFDIEYSTKLFKRETIERMTLHLTKILEIVVNTQIKLSEIDILTEKERDQILYDFNKTEANYPKDKTLCEFFEEQVVKASDDIAVVFEKENLTYKELNAKANQLARVLRQKGIKPDRIVAIMLERSIEMIVGILAIVKAGGAYLPIDPEYPLERKQYMLKDSGAKILLTQTDLTQEISFAGEILTDLNSLACCEESSNIEIVNKPGDLLYLIYTSGSTGKPKGVMIEHRNIVNLINFEYAKTNINFNTRVLQFTTISFDVSCQEIFSTLLAGGELYLIDNETRKSPEKLLDFVNTNEIEVVFFPTAYFKFIVCEREYMEKFSERIKHIIVAGEQLIITEELKQYLKENRVYLHNHYGPSEAHVVSTYTVDMMEEMPDLPPIGKPISNTKLYIGNKDKDTKEIRLVPIGVVGELFISGDCVGRGYYNRPELTSEKFMIDPFRPEHRLYSTGDLVRWIADGNIEFLGRIDHQVKIRGYRIEIGEIESQILRHEAIKETVVMAKEDSNSKYLCAYVVGESEFTISDLREYMSKDLPEYMIPTYFVKLDKMPLTQNGKIDRNALPEPEGNIEVGVEYVAPTNEVEEKLVEIWSEVLKIEKVGVMDNFFELGGHSLKATILAGRIQKELDVEVSLKQIFKSPTIKGVSKYIKSAAKVQYEAIEKVDDLGCNDTGYYETSSAQKRMYLLQQMDLRNVNYNMPGVLEVEGRLDVKKVEKAFLEMIKRHETLRTSLELIEDKLVQIVNAYSIVKSEFEVKYIEHAQKTPEQIINEFIKPFDLSKAPLFKVGIIKLESEKYILMFDMHHIISDGITMGIFVNDFVNLYEGKELDSLRIQYKDYSGWQNKLVKSDIMKKQEEYWVNRFSEVPVLNLPTDYPRPAIQSFAGDTLSFKVDRDLTEKIKGIAKETASTMYMVLLSGVNILLSKYSGQEDIIVGSPIAGRPHADLEKIIGMFINTLAMRNNLAGNKTYKELLKEVKDNALEAYEHQDYQFEELVDKLNLHRDMSRNPLFDVMFVLQNFDNAELEVQDLKFRPLSYENKISKFDLTISAYEDTS